MLEEIMDIIIRVTAVLLMYGLGYLGKVGINWIKTKIGEKEQEQFDYFLNELVRAAEQMFNKEDDSDGSKRLSYVQEVLIESGYELTDALRALIEAQVFTLNQYTNR